MALGGNYQSADENQAGGTPKPLRRTIEHQQQLTNDHDLSSSLPAASEPDDRTIAASQILDSATNSVSSSNPICHQQSQQLLLSNTSNDSLSNFTAQASYYNHHPLNPKSFNQQTPELDKNQVVDQHLKRQTSNGDGFSLVPSDRSSSLVSREKQKSCCGPRAKRIALVTMQIVGVFLLLDLLVYYWPMEEPSIEAPKVAGYRPRPSYRSSPWLSNELLDEVGESLFTGQFNAPESMAWTADRRAFYTGVEGGFILLVEPYEERWTVVAKLNGRSQVRDLSAGNGTNWVPFCELDTELYGPRAEFEPQLIVISRCSRPLGIRLHPAGSHLYVSDPLSGLYRIEVPAEAASRPQVAHPVSRLLALGAGAPAADGVGAIMFADDIAVDWALNSTIGRDLIYLTDCSRRWTLRFLLRLMAENDDSGRLLEIEAGPEGIVKPLRELPTSPTLDPASQELDFRNLSFPNGVELSSNGSALMLADLNNRRLIMKHLRGPLAGQTRHLLWTPGYPDNIRRGLDLPDGRASFWVACGCAADDGRFEVAEFMNEYPKLRRLLLRWIHFLGVGIDWLGQRLEWTTLRDAGLIVKAGWLKVDPYCRHGLVFQFTEDGQVTRTLQTTSFSSKFKLLSEAHEVPLWTADGTNWPNNNTEARQGASLFSATNRSALYLGSVYNSYLGRIKL